MTNHEDRFRSLYAENFNALLAYALRRVDQPPDAADVVADTFLVAWRREGPRILDESMGCSAQGLI